MIEIITKSEDAFLRGGAFFKHLPSWRTNEFSTQHSVEFVPKPPVFVLVSPERQEKRPISVNI